MKFTWYVRRLRAMGPAEIWARLRDRIVQEHWRWRYYVRSAAPQPNVKVNELRFRGGLARALAQEAPTLSRKNLLTAADALLDGCWPTFAIQRKDVTAGVDWHLDPKNKMTLSADVYTFDIRIHGEGLYFETKYVWELSRHNHTCVLAMAHWLTGDARYAEAAVAQIQSWCVANPFLHGVHWSSGIELGMRLVAFTWVRRLLEEWSDTRAHFENSREFIQCVYQHQWWLARRMSSGSSANNHLIYEAAGLYIAACSMPWFAESADWRKMAKAILEREFRKQTFASGINRELGSGYNAYILEALALCLIEGVLSDDPWPEAAWQLAADIILRLADFADCKGYPPRQGDSDDARGLLLDAPDFEQWSDLLQLGAAWFHRAVWWPRLDERPLRSWLWSHIARPPREIEKKINPARDSLAADAGLAILRSGSNTPNEIYCAFDAGPLGYLSIAAHGHADALAVEVRYGGQPILVDPGTFSYAEADLWRSYFRSTAAHNTLEISGASQSESGGPFLWTRAAHARLLATYGLDEDAPVASVDGEHDGYLRRFGLSHHRRVMLDRECDKLIIEDKIVGPLTVPARLMFQLHPAIGCYLIGHVAQLTWIGGKGPQQAELVLPELMSWREISGAKHPMLGWYSPSYDFIVPTRTLVGSALVSDATCLRTTIKFDATNREADV